MDQEKMVSTDDPRTAITSNSSESMEEQSPLLESIMETNVADKTNITIYNNQTTHSAKNKWFEKQGIKIMHLNIHYLYPKFDEIKILLSEHPEIDILGLCETFLNEHFTGKEVNLNDYQLFRKDRKSNGGGIVLYVKNNFPCIRRIDLENENNEIMWLEIHPVNQKPFILGYVYRPPSVLKSWTNEYEIILEKVTCEDKETIIMGDFNINLLSNTSESWKTMNNLFNFTQFVDSPTRITHSSATIIDHVYSNVPCFIQNVNVPLFSLSDHYPICFTRKTSIKSDGPMHKMISYRNVKNFNEELFLQDLQYQPWSTIDIYDDPNDALDYFVQLFTKTLDNHAPIKSKRVKYSNQPEWYTSDIKSDIKQRDRYKACGDYENFKLYRNRVRNKIRKSKKQLVSESIKNNHKQNPSKLWKTLKDLTGTSSKTQSNFINDDYGNPILDHKQMADTFNDFFINIVQSFQSDASSNNNCADSTPNPNTGQTAFEIPLLQESFVEKQLLNINQKKATGLDGLSPKFLRLSAKVISKPVTKIMNLSVTKNIFPNHFKIAKVTPIHKKGATSDKSNYRPISILPVLSKIIERHVAYHIKSYLEEHNLLYENQSGFRTNHSCETALISIVDRWISAINDNQYVGTVFLDLSKAFDLVNHSILIKKLTSFNFSPKSLQWFTSYLSNRCQKVCVSGKLSEPGHITCGVPQGSVLGPLLFIMYINDMPNELKDIFTDMFADDTTITAVGKSYNEVQNQLQNNIDKIFLWCQNNSMALNPKKTKSMIISASNKKCSNKNLSLHLGQDTIEFSNCERLLGVQVDNNLTWKNQVNMIVKKCNSKLYLLQRIKQFINIPVRKLFYNAYILPHLEYCCSVWGNCNSSYSDILIKFQKRAARIILEKDFDTPSQELFSSLNWMKFPERVNYKKSIIMYKAINNICPQYLSKKFMKNNVECTHYLRSAENNQLLHVPKPRLEFTKKSLDYSGPKLWNALPNEVQTARTLDSFKQKYTLWWKTK
ncbi:hypothetical protein ACF0H5_003591 [Mactra antiquata]